MNQVDAQSLWLRAIEEIKLRTTRPALWRALEVSHGVILEGNTFVIGFLPQDSPQAGHLRSSEVKTTMEKVLKEMLNLDITVKLIDGITVADYENVKRQEAAYEATRQLLAQRKFQERRSDRLWEEIGEKISRKNAASKLRSLPQMRARLINEAYQIISEAMDEHYPEEPDEFTERALGRLIERLAIVTDVPAPMLAYELLRLRAEGKLAKKADLDGSSNGSQGN